MPEEKVAQTAAAAQETFGAELARYQNAKKRGRGTTSMCSLCSSPFTVSKQQEAAILFALQVYSNKLSLHGSNVAAIFVRFVDWR
ncbi:MAG: hypothetical protein R2932_59795 [Caldilineaceae bacterium]